jgi:hypothetical protein
LTPLPIEVPADQQAEHCAEILGQLVQVQGETADQAAIDAGEVSGCEMTATTSEAPRLATYWALVFRSGGTFLVGGTVEARRRSPWIERFRGAARTVQPTRAIAATSAL